MDFASIRKSLGKEMYLRNVQILHVKLTRASIDIQKNEGITEIVNTVNLISAAN